MSNVDTFLPVYTTSRLRKQKSSLNELVYCCHVSNFELLTTLLFKDKSPSVKLDFIRHLAADFQTTEKKLEIAASARHFTVGRSTDIFHVEV
jgi:hypothetical protein